MIFKMAFRNMKKSMSDYTVYFVTLIIGISVFYVFNSISDQKIMQIIFEHEYDIIEVIRNTLSVASVIVSTVLAFLVVYASNFLMRRRKREFGVYMILGMEKRKIAGILMAETVIIGLISLVIGLLIGVILSQGMSVWVASIFEADMSKFTFDISKQAVVKTIGYFLIMYALVLLLDLFVVGKSRLISLLTSANKTEKNMAVNPFVCVVVFAVAALVLASAYYNVTAGMQELNDTASIMAQIVKGIVATVLIFWSVAGLFLFVAKLRKKHYFRGINAFTVNEIGKRINTNVFAGSVICLMLFITICVLSTSFTVNRSMNDNLKTLVPVEINIVAQEKEPGEGKVTPVRQVLAKKEMDVQMFRDVVDIYSYTVANNALTMADTVGEEYMESLEQGGEGSKDYVDYMRGESEEIMKVGDYNPTAKLNGQEQFALAEDEYMIIANYESMQEARNQGLDKGVTITIGGKQYHPKYKECKESFVEISQNSSNMGIILVPDSVDMTQLVPFRNYFLANYNKEYAGGEKNIDSLVNSQKFQKKLGKHIVVSTRSDLYKKSIGMTAVVVFMGLYLGIVFVIASAALLSLKELSQASDSRDTYRILRGLGVDEKMIRHSLFRQQALFFGLPLSLAIIHSIFGIRVSMYIVGVFGLSGLREGILVTAGIILSIYIMYFAVTYRCGRRIIEE